MWFQRLFKLFPCFQEGIWYFTKRISGNHHFRAIVFVITAIRYHSTGCENMSTLSKVLFVADYIEDSRGGTWNKEAVDASYVSLDKAVKIILNQKVDFLRKSGRIICELTFKALNYYLEYGEEC